MLVECGSHDMWPVEKQLMMFRPRGLLDMLKMFGQGKVLMKITNLSFWDKKLAILRGLEDPGTAALAL